MQSTTTVQISSLANVKKVMDRAIQGDNKVEENDKSIVKRMVSPNYKWYTICRYNKND